jgi:hypothetical protein
VIATLGLSVLVFAPIFSAILPGADRLWVSREAAAMIARHSPSRPISAVGYAEPSLVFLLGTATRLVSPEQAAVDLASGASAAVIVADRDETAFLQALAAQHAAARAIDRVAGFNYSRARRVALTLYEPAER